MIVTKRNMKINFSIRHYCAAAYP